MTTTEKDYLIIFGVLLAMIVIALALAGLVDESNDTKTPEGCVYIDMDPSKPQDLQLACVEGYGWNR